MKDKVILIEMLIDKIEQYGKTSIELYKLKAIDRSTDVFASLASRIVVFVTIAYATYYYIPHMVPKLDVLHTTQAVNTQTHSNTYTYTHTYAYTYTHVYIYTHTCTYSYIFVRIHENILFYE